MIFLMIWFEKNTLWPRWPSENILFILWQQNAGSHLTCFGQLLLPAGSSTNWDFQSLHLGIFNLKPPTLKKVSQLPLNRGSKRQPLCLTGWVGLTSWAALPVFSLKNIGEAHTFHSFKVQQSVKCTALFHPCCALVVLTQRSQREH